MRSYTKKELMTQIAGKLSRNFGRSVDEATPQQVFKACALVLRDPPSADAGEITDKGYVNQRAVLQRRADQGRGQVDVEVLQQA